MPTPRIISRVLAALALMSLGLIPLAAPVRAAVCDGSSDSLGNGGFQSPPVADDSIHFFTPDEIPPWQTTDSNNQIEVWGTNFNGVPAGEGNAFAELNANSAGTLYQDVVSTPGATMTWTLLHRGREGDDSMQVLIGDANTADVNGATGWDFISADLTDGNSAWGTHTDDYVVPAGQTCTRFAFRATNTASGDPSVGNFIDGIAFTVSIPAGATPTPRPSVRVTSPPTTSLDQATPASADVRLAIVVVVVVAATFGALTIRPRKAGRRE